jgi:hypothetical protein
LNITLGEYQMPYFDISKEIDYQEFNEWRQKNAQNDIAS